MIRSFFVILCVFSLLVGCATVSQSSLYWGNYSQTLYQVKMNPGEESKKAHQEELQKIVDKSKKLNIKVPPGVYAELGLYAKANNDSQAANNYFQLEQEMYPEFGTLMKSTLDI